MRQKEQDDLPHNKGCFQEVHNGMCELEWTAEIQVEASAEHRNICSLSVSTYEQRSQ